jgi:predicted MPP superfamily phosphohydrolase
MEDQKRVLPGSRDLEPPMRLGSPPEIVYITLRSPK